MRDFAHRHHPDPAPGLQKPEFELRYIAPLSRLQQALSTRPSSRLLLVFHLVSLRDVFCSSFSGGFRKLRIGSGPKRPRVSRERLIGLITRHPVALLIRSLSGVNFMIRPTHMFSGIYPILKLFVFYFKKHETLIVCLFFLTCKDYLMTHKKILNLTIFLYLGLQFKFCSTSCIWIVLDFPTTPRLQLSV